MITKYLTNVTAKFNPFSRQAIAARLFLTQFPADSRSQIKMSTVILPPTSKENPVLDLMFKDGKELKINLQEFKVDEIVEQVDRHSRLLARKEDLAGG